MKIFLKFSNIVFEKFVNSTFEELNQLLTIPCGPAAVIAAVIAAEIANTTSTNK